MKIYVPDYYKKFRCIAGACKNSCCIGWEIDIDEIALEKYKSTGGDFGKRLKKCISTDGDAHFILAEGERCPFLNEDNLCDIYIELGEESLCDICSDHPRFRNFYADRTEMGVGLCCEAATKLILENEGRLWLELFSDDGAEEDADEEESVAFALREKALEIVGDCKGSAVQTSNELLSAFCENFPEKTFDEWLAVFLSLEILDEQWRGMLMAAKGQAVTDTQFVDSEKGRNAQCQLLNYFLFRHMADGIYDGSLGARVGFAVLSVYIIRRLCEICDNPSFESFADIARRYSAEVEYCEENVEKLLEVISGEEM